MARGDVGTLAILLRVWFSSRILRIATLLAVVAAVAAGFWFRDQMATEYNRAQDSAITALGLGVVIAPLWAVAVLWVPQRAQSWRRRFQFWAGSVAIVAFVMGILALFQPATGPMASFTLDGRVSLAGDVGDPILGQTGWQGAMLLAAFFLAAALLTVPRPTLKVGSLLGAGLVFIYVWSFVGIKSIFSLVGRPYRFKPETRFEEPNAPSTTAAGYGGALGIDVPQEPGPSVSVPGPLSEPDETVAEVVQSDQPSPVSVLAEAQDEESGPDSESRVNRFWGSSRADNAQESPTTNGHSEPKERVVLGGSWDLPPIGLLEDAPQGGISEEQMEETAKTIERTLAEYGVEVEMGERRPGPAVTMYGLIPGWVRRYKQVKATDEFGEPVLDESGRPKMERAETKTRVKVDSILSREKDLALALRTHSIRIETPVMGQSLVGIEVPNPKPDLVTLRGVMESEEFGKLRTTAKLPVALGKGSGGETAVIDLAAAPHLLIAGATGSGKSVCLNTVVSCLIKEKSPEEMRLLLVDPKRVELTPFNGIPHLLTPVVVETDQVVALLKGLIREMLNRYRRMETEGVRNIEAYNERIPERMPFLVVVVDELADLMMSASFDVEQSLCRLAQLGRATGIHLIVATQRPSVDVVTGLIKANFPSRISFGVTSQIDSRTILDSVGAEKLLGQGDMLYLGVEASRPERVQGVYISDREIDRLVHFWQSASPGPLADISLQAVAGDSPEDGGEPDDDVDADRDEFIDKAIELAHQYKKLSTSLLQRRLRIGYPRAARLMDSLEEEGIVGPPSDGAKSRDVIIEV